MTQTSPSSGQPSPDEFEITVDGELFTVEYDTSQPGAYHYTRLTGPAPGYGFVSRRSDHQRSPVEHHEQRIRDFLELLDPLTGYIEDD